MDLLKDLTYEHFTGGSNFLFAVLGLMVSVYLAPIVCKFLCHAWKHKESIGSFFINFTTSDFIRTITGLLFIFAAIVTKVGPLAISESIAISGNGNLIEYWMSISWTWTALNTLLMPLGTLMIMYPTIMLWKKKILDIIWPNRNLSGGTHVFAVSLFAWILAGIILLTGMVVTHGLSLLF